MHATASGLKPGGASMRTRATLPSGAKVTFAWPKPAGAPNARWIDRQNADSRSRGSKRPRHRRDERALADAGRTGDPDPARTLERPFAAKAREERRHLSA